jgi:hypothetical protein
MGAETGTEIREHASDTVNLPAPTAWPIVLAFGITLLFAGLVTTAVVGILGAILMVGGIIGWFRDVLPHEKHEFVPVVEADIPVVTSHPEVTQVDWVRHEVDRARLPLEIYPISAGVKGGLAGSVAMAVLAVIYGILKGRGIWYPINLLVAGFFPERATVEQLSVFNWEALLLASAIHLVTSLLVGLLYGATLPMFPRHPILLGGLIAPLLWSGLLHSEIELLNPVLNRRIDWLWFAISQMGFGLVAGIVVSKQERIRTWQHLPFKVRAGIEVPGAIDAKDGEEGRR